MGLPFDADALQAAIDPPRVRLGGVVYTGRVLSDWQLMPFRAIAIRAQALKALPPEQRDEATTSEVLTELERAFWQLMRLTFPRRWWQMGRVDVVAKLRRLPSPVLREWRDYFFAYLARLLLEDERVSPDSERPTFTAPFDSGTPDRAPTPMPAGRASERP